MYQTVEDLYGWWQHNGENEVNLLILYACAKEGLNERQHCVPTIHWTESKAHHSSYLHTRPCMASVYAHVVYSMLLGYGYRNTYNLVLLTAMQRPSNSYQTR